MNIATPEGIWSQTIIDFCWWLIAWILSISTFIIRVIDKVYMTFKLIYIEFIMLTLGYHVRIVTILGTYKSMYMARLRTTI